MVMRYRNCDAIIRRTSFMTFRVFHVLGANLPPFDVPVARIVGMGFGSHYSTHLHRAMFK